MSTTKTTNTHSYEELLQRQKQLEAQIFGISSPREPEPSVFSTLPLHGVKT